MAWSLHLLSEIRYMGLRRNSETLWDSRILELGLLFIWTASASLTAFMTPGITLEGKNHLRRSKPVVDFLLRPSMQQTSCGLTTVEISFQTNWGAVTEQGKLRWVKSKAAARKAAEPVCLEHHFGRPDYLTDPPTYQSCCHQQSWCNSPKFPCYVKNIT